MPKRSYSMQRRVALEAETRECIVRATVALHARHGALATTYAMIAKRAQVATQTVYNHFPDDSALLGACTGHVLDRAPPLALEKIRSVRSPAARLRLLAEVVFARHEFMAPWLSWHEAAVIPALGEIIAKGSDALRALIAAVVAPDHDSTPDFVDAAFVLLDFPAWQALTRTRSSAEAAHVAGKCLADLLPRLTSPQLTRRRQPS